MTCLFVSIPTAVLVRTIETANFLLESTVERLHHKLDYADRDIGELIHDLFGIELIPVGVLLIRGENVVALGEIVGCFQKLYTTEDVANPGRI